MENTHNKSTTSRYNSVVAVLLMTSVAQRPSQPSSETQGVKLPAFSWRTGALQFWSQTNDLLAYSTHHCRGASELLFALAWVKTSRSTHERAYNDSITTVQLHWKHQRNEAQMRIQEYTGESKQFTDVNHYQESGYWLRMRTTTPTIDIPGIFFSCVYPFVRSSEHWRNETQMRIQEYTGEYTGESKQFTNVYNYPESG